MNSSELSKPLTRFKLTSYLKVSQTGVVDFAQVDFPWCIQCRSRFNANGSPSTLRFGRDLIGELLLFFPRKLEQGSTLLTVNSVRAQIGRYGS
jgi:hypothetical protein